MTCGVREARDQFSSLRRRALQGEEIIIKADTRHEDSASQAVSLIPTWFLDELTLTVTDWAVGWLGNPGQPVSEWEFDGDVVKETANTSASDAYVVEHKATGITGVGVTRDQAIESLIDGLLEYADEYYSALAFYLSPKSGRRGHYPYVRVLKRLENDRKRLRDMFHDQDQQ